MSLSRLGMRIAAARALRGATLAEDRVFDSMIDPMQLTTGDGEPALVVTTDDHNVSADGRDLTGGNHSCDLVIEMLIASQTAIPGTDGGQTVEITVPHVDEGMEVVLDLMEAQVARALSGGDGVWPSVWRAMVPRIEARSSRRGASAESGVRFAARQLILTCDLVADPVPGAEPPADHAFGRLLAAMDADGALAPIAQILRAQIVDDRADWRIAADALGVDEATTPSIGIGGATGNTADDPAAVEEIDLGDGVVVNETTANEKGSPDA